MVKNRQNPDGAEQNAADDAALVDGRLGVDGDVGHVLERKQRPRVGKTTATT